MDDFKGRGGGKGSFGGPRKPYVKREGGYDRKPREGGFGGERKPYGPRAEGASGERRPYTPRGEGTGERRPYTPRGEGSSFGERKPYVKREGGYGRPREDGERRPYTPRGEGTGERRPYTPRGEGSSFGERKPYVKREGGYDRKPREDGERRPYTPRGEGTGERRPYTPRGPRAEGGSSFGERKPYVKREGGYDRKPREDGERRPYTPRGDGERRPYTPRGEGSSFGERKPRYSRDFDERTDRRPEETSWEAAPGERLVSKRQVEFMHPQADGWLVGPHAVKAALKAGRRSVKELWVMETPVGELATLMEGFADLPVLVKDRGAFDDRFGDLVHQGIALQVGNLEQPEFTDLLERKPQLIVALDQVTDPHNFGAILRSCAAFGVGAVLTLERRSASVTPVVAKAAAGGLEVVPVVEVGNLAQTLKTIKEAGYTVLGLAGEGTLPLTAVTVDGPVCVVMGSEGDGLRRLTKEGCDHLVKIPQDMGAVGSLNVSVAAGIALYALTR